MREQYFLSDETRKVLTDNVSAIAAEWDKNPSYLYQILSDATGDPFAKFKAFYSAAVRAGVSVTEWDAALSQIKKRYRAISNESDCLAAKITLDAETTAKMVTALQDGIIDEREAGCIRLAIGRERDSLDALEAVLAREPVNDMRAWARGAVKANRNGGKR